MTPQPPMPPGLMLGRQQQVALHDVRLLPVAGVVFAEGGCDIPGRVIRLEMVDVQHATQYIIPLDITFAERLHKQLGELITNHNKQTLEGK